MHEVWTIEMGVGVGPFRLGASVAEALHALKVRIFCAHVCGLCVNCALERVTRSVVPPSLL